MNLSYMINFIRESNALTGQGVDGGMKWLVE
jgi:hypothetical protein